VAIAALRSAIADACATATPLRIAGGGTWLSAGHPVQASTVISTADVTGIVEYVPGDLVLTARAGTTLREIAEVTASHGQWLALDPYLSDAGRQSATIGATIATASHGPLALGYGRVRDLTLGVSMISGDGTLLRAGGRVVKNVAGFDLTRLMIGAWGTLGVITEVSMRLHARPALDRTFAIPVPVSAPDAREQMMAHITAQLNQAPLLHAANALASLVVLSHTAVPHIVATHGLPSSDIVLLARAMGNSARVSAQQRALAELGDVTEISSDVWESVRALDDGELTFRLQDAPSRTSATWRRASSWLESHRADARVVSEPLRGVVRVMGTIDDAAHRSFELPQRAIAERLSARAWASQRSAVNDAISQRLRTAFDPTGILNPGILGAENVIA
jgi:glycolate oxidase FAD binding subunit